MLPQHDDLEFDADVVSILPIGETRLPEPVLAWGRQLLANQLIHSDGEAHGTFSMDYGDTKWIATIRQEPWGGHKIIFRELSCRDRLPAYTAFDSSEAPTGYFGFYRDGTEEEIDPLDGKPRPGGDTATNQKTKFYRLPPQLREAVPSAYTPANSLVTAAMYTGQMRETVQCIHQRGSDSPYGFSHGLTHGIVEAPHPRVVGADAAEERANHGLRRFWLVEISSSGVFATRVRSSKRCCDSWLPSWAVKDTNGDYSFTALSTKFSEPGQTVVTQLLASGDVADAYSSSKVSPTGAGSGLGISFGDWTGWAFSYSGHQAQNVVFRNASGTLSATRCRIDFTVAVGPPATISASFTTVELDVASVMPSSRPGNLPVAGTFFLHDTPVISGASVASTISDAPVYVFYDGDDERVVRVTVSSTEVAIEVTGALSFTTPVSGSIPSGTYEIGTVTPTIPFLDREAIVVLTYVENQTCTVLTTFPDPETRDITGELTHNLYLVGRSETFHIGESTSIIIPPPAPFPPYSSCSPGIIHLDNSGVRNQEVSYFMGAGTFYADPTTAVALDKTDKLMLTYSITTAIPSLITGFPADTVVPSGFLTPDIYPGGWIGRI